jgi:DNA-binding NarL/FixJ family response regulator
MEENSLIRIFLIEDDHEVILPGLRSRFRPSRDNIDFIGSAPCVQDAVKVARAQTFDLFFLDLFIPGTTPEKNISALKKAFPKKPVVIYSTEQSTVWKSIACRAGASAFLTKKDDKVTMKNVIQQVMNGVILIYESSEQVIFDSIVPNSNESITQSNEAGYSLTMLEKEILLRLRHGDTMKTIGLALDLNENKVEKLLAQLRKTCQAKNNIHLLHILSTRRLI